MSNSTDEGDPGPVPDDDDFFGDQSSVRTEHERQVREVEVLRRQHMTTGIREGASSSREAHLQEGFDDGFNAGAKAAAEPGFLLGACSFLDAFFAKGASSSARSTGRSQVFDDTELPMKDLDDLKNAAGQLRQRLRELPENGSVSVETAVDACSRVAVIEVPSQVRNTG